MVKRRDFMSLVVAAGSSLRALATTKGVPNSGTVTGAVSELPASSPTPLYPTEHQRRFRTWPDMGWLKSGIYDVIWDTLYDSQEFVPGSTIPSRIPFFDRAENWRQPCSETNLHGPGVLLAPQCMMIQEVSVVLLHQGDPVAEVLKHYCGELVLGFKSYAMGALWTLPLEDPDFAGSPPPPVMKVAEYHTEEIGGFDRTWLPVADTAMGHVILPQMRFHFDVFHGGAPYPKPEILQWRGEHSLVIGVLLSGWRARGVQ